jgi:hypothetical protein
MDIKGVNSNVTLRQTIVELPEPRQTMDCLRDIADATRQDFQEIVEIIGGKPLSDEFKERVPAEYAVELEYAAKELVIARIPNTDPVCTIWGKVNGITVTVTSSDVPMHALTAYYALHDLLPAASTTAPQSAPTPAPAHDGTVQMETVPQSESGTYELGDYDYKMKAEYGARYDGKYVAFFVERINRGFKKDTTIPEFRLYTHENWQYPNFYVDEEHAGTMLPTLEALTANGDAVGRWRCVVRVVAKNGKVYFNPVKIGAVTEPQDAEPF